MTEVADREPGFVRGGADLAGVDAELARHTGGLSAVVVTGEPGIGKTRVLTEVRRRAERAGWLVVAGQATEHERELPFSAFADALTPLALADPAIVDRLPASLACAVGAVLPAMAVGASAGAMRHHAYLATATLLELFAARRPLLVVLDDLHWADDGTVELVDQLVRHRFGRRVLLAVGYRPRQVSGRLAAALGRADAVRFVRLQPLSLAQAAQLLGTGPDDPATRRLYDAADGNPLYLRTLAAWSPDQPLPADVRAALRAEVEGLPPAARTVAHAAAVLGTAFDPSPLPAVAALPPERVWPAVDELVAADLLRSAGASGRLRFRHPLIRDVVYEAAGAGWRRLAHGRAADVLTARSAPPDLLAHHVAHAAVSGDEAAIRVLLRAAAADRWRAPATAAQWYAAALRLLPADRRWPARRARLLLAKAECLMTAGELADSQRTVAEAIPLLRHRARPVLRRAVRVAAAVSQLRGRPDEAAAMLRQAAGQRGLADPELRLQLAAVELLRGDLPAAWRLADEVRDDVSAELGASSILAFLHVSAGDAVRAGAVADAAAASLDASSDADLARQLAPAVWLMWVDVTLGRYTRALRVQDRAIELGRASGQGHLVAQWLIGRSETLRRTGRLDEAGRLADEAYDLARLSGSAELVLFAVTAQCWVAISRGDVALARRRSGELTARAGGRPGLFGVLGRAVAAEALLLAGEPQACIAGVLDAGGDDLGNFDPGSRIVLCGLLVRAALAAGRIADATAWADRAAELDRRGALPYAAGQAALAAARVLLATDRAGEAVAAGRRAAGELDAVGHPLDAAQARLVVARALAALGRRAEALTALHEADALAAGCGAERLRAEVSRELRRLGRRVPRTGPRAGPGRHGLQLLSQRERQVAELAAGGGTNRAIAAQLFLSEKTVERHLSSAFVKLGVSSRTALATRVATSALSA